MKNTHTEIIEILSNEEGDAEYSFEEVIERSPRQEKKSKISGVVTATLFFDEATAAFYIRNPLDNQEQIVVNKTLVDIDDAHIGKDVLVMFENENVYQPILTGVVRALNSDMRVNNLRDETGAEAVVDGQERLIFSAEREIVLQCGKSSIHLTKAGKVIIRGTYLLSRSSGVNSIKGGSVSIN